MYACKTIRFYLPCTMYRDVKYVWHLCKILRRIIWVYLDNTSRRNSIKKRNIVFIISRPIQTKVHEDKTYSEGLRKITSFDQNKIYRSVPTIYRKSNHKVFKIDSLKLFLLTFRIIAFESIKELRRMNIIKFLTI